MNPDIAYMLDTNVLYDWLYSYIPQIKSSDPYYKHNPHKWTHFKKRLSGIKQFMEHNENTIYIPDLVWSEFLGVMLHKDMDVSGDLHKLKLHFRLLLGVVQQMELLIQNSPNIHFFSPNSENFSSSPYADAAELVTDLDLFDQRLFKQLKNIGRDPNKITEKFLDGMDAVIVTYLDGLAANHPEQRIMLYSGDYRLFLGFSRVRNYWKRYGFSQNTGAIFSSFNTVRSKNGLNHPATILRKKKVKTLGVL